MKIRTTCFAAILFVTSTLGVASATSKTVAGVVGPRPTAQAASVSSTPTITRTAAAGRPTAAPTSFRAAVQPLARVAREQLPPVDAKALAAEDAFGKDFGLPERFAVPIATSLTPDNSGTWETLPDGSWLWRLRLGSPGALSLNLAFDRFSLPASAKLWFYNPSRAQVQGPYTRADRSRHGRLYTPVVLGDEAVVELHVAAADVRRVRLTIGQVNYGYRGFDSLAKSGSCNIDVVCSQGNAWRDQIRAVARYSIDGQFLCSGTLVNNTAGDLRPLFLSAFHCDVTSANDDTVVVYWNYQSPNCGQQGGGSLAQNQAGSTLRASFRSSDLLLFELSRKPDTGFNVYYAGWDATGARPASTVAIHHPNGDEKAITFDHDPPGDMANPIINGATALTHWKVFDYEQGTTEQGSSGSCIFDEASKKCIGTLSGGTASCTVTDGFDGWGKVSVHWDGGGSSSSRLRDWLDPVNGGNTRTLAGKNPSTGQPGVCVASATTMCLLGGRYEAKVNWTNQFDGSSGTGKSVPFTDFAGFFYFTDSANLELMLKILDFGGGTIKVFYGQLTNLQFQITLRETATGRAKVYANGPGDCGAIDQSFQGALGDVVVVDKSLDPVVPKAVCTANSSTLCLLNKRFSVQVDWRNQFNGQSGKGTPTTLSSLSGFFYYTDSRNVELLVKALDFGDRILFIYGALSDLEYSIRVTDNTTGKVKTYFNPGGQYCGGLDNDFNGSGGGGGGGGTINEVEPNNTSSQAQVLSGTLPLTVRGAAQTSDTSGNLSIRFSNPGTPNDHVEDLYRVTTNFTGLSFRLSGLSADLDLYVLDASLSTILAPSGSQGNNSGTVDEFWSLPNLGPGTYYIAVSIYEADPIAPSSSYTLTLQ
jgi:hypothetical protein